MAAALRVDLKRQRQITELGERLHHISSKLIPKAELVIDPGSRSQYVGLRSRDQYPLPIKGFHIQLDLSIENKGNRMSSIKRFGLALADFGKGYPEIKPYFTQTVAGRNCNFALNRTDFFSPEEYIRIPGESVAGPKLLAFQILDLSLDNFGEVAFVGDRETRIFPPIHCELTVTDTEGNSASHLFLLEELK
jgi:hypothetical protein